MSLVTSLNELIRAGFAGIWIDSQEHPDAIAELAALARRERWQLVCWNIERGLHGGETSAASGGEVADPLAAVRASWSLAGAALAAPDHQATQDTEAAQDATSILVLENFHRFLGSAEVVQALAHAVSLGKTQRTFLVILSPVVTLPVELEKLFVVVEHPRPDAAQLEEIARGIASEAGELPDGPALRQLLDASAGLTRYEAENAYSLSLVRHGRLEPAAIWELKTQSLRQGGLLSLYRGAADFAALGGLAALKAFTRRALRCGGSGQVGAGPGGSGPSTSCLARPRGVLLLSPPGCGKSEFCKALGAEVGRPVLLLDVGSLMGSLVGQSEERTRQALRTIDAMAPCIVMIDEIEKAFAGVGGGSSGDSGVSSRMFGTFLSWLADHQSDVFVVCTANDVSRLPPEFARAERFDGVFFLDLPDRDQKDAIWAIYLAQFGLDLQQRRPADEQWTGAEIRACCRLAALLDLPLVQAAQNVVPIAVTSGEAVQRLRGWASGRCLSADAPGLYRFSGSPAAAAGGQRRKVNRDPSVN
jgi:hypothetical protein